MGRRNPPETQKPWTIAHEIGQTCPKSRVFTMPVQPCTKGHDHRNPTRTQKPWTIAHDNGQKCPKPRVLTMLAESCVRVMGRRTPPGTQKPWTIAHEIGQKCPKSRVLTMPLESCTEGHRASKPYRDPKIVDYSPRKRPEMPEIPSFDDVSRVVYWGSWGVEILPGPENHGL